MDGFYVLGNIILGLIALHLIYFFVVVPFHYWMAGKIGCGYDPQKNRFTHGDHCHTKCWHRKYKKEL